MWWLSVSDQKRTSQANCAKDLRPGSCCHAGSKPMKRRLAAILAADIVGYSRLKAADETGTPGRVNALLDGPLRPLAEARGGRIFKVVGDGVLAGFGPVVEAVECAVAIRRGIRARGRPRAYSQRRPRRGDTRKHPIEDHSATGCADRPACGRGDCQPGTRYRPRHEAARRVERVPLTAIRVVDSRGDHRYLNCKGKARWNVN